MQQGPPTSKQLSYLRWLAERTGTTFTPPQTVQEASLAIKHLRARRRMGSGEITRERRTIKHDMATQRGDAAQVTPGELEAVITWVTDHETPKPATGFRRSHEQPRHGRACCL